MKNTKIKITKWLEQLPDGYREQALKNHEEYLSSGLITPWPKEVCSLHDAVNAAFMWISSPEGEDYWNSIFLYLRGTGERDGLPRLKESAIIKKQDPITILEWLQTLPEPIRSQAIENTPPVNGKIKSDSLVNSLNSAFPHRASPQGVYYWLDFIKLLNLAKEFNLDLVAK